MEVKFSNENQSSVSTLLKKILKKKNIIIETMPNKRQALRRAASLCFR